MLYMEGFKKNAACFIKLIKSFFYLLFFTSNNPEIKFAARDLFPGSFICSVHLIEINIASDFKHGK